MAKEEVKVTNDIVDSLVTISEKIHQMAETESSLSRSFEIKEKNATAVVTIGKPDETD